MSIYSNFGFDETRTESAADSPKYKLLNTLKQLGIEQFPIEQANDIFAKVQGALGESGLYSFDAKNANIDLTKDRGGYVGIRPVDRSNPNGAQTFQWMAYNDSVKPQGGWQPGDYGEGSPYGDWTGQGSRSGGDLSNDVYENGQLVNQQSKTTLPKDPDPTTTAPATTTKLPDVVDYAPTSLNPATPGRITAPGNERRDRGASEGGSEETDLADALRRLSRLFQSPKV